MGLCLCETTWSLFRTVKTYQWKELDQGNVWEDVINKWEAWVNRRLNAFDNAPWKLNQSGDENTLCLNATGSANSKTRCYHYFEFKTDAEFGIEPEPKSGQVVPKNKETPEDEYGQEQGPYWSDPPGDYWDGSSDSWMPIQREPTCPSSCVDTDGGQFTSGEKDPNKSQEWKRDPVVKDHYEEVEVKFWLDVKRFAKIGYERSCCNGQGVSGFGYEQGWQSDCDDMSPGCGKFYEPDWSGEPALKVMVPFGLFYNENWERRGYKKIHACL